MKIYTWVLLLNLYIVHSSLDQDPYKVLGLKKGVGISDVKKAYKGLARQWHPDKNDSPEAEARFIEISEAYELLSDPKKKEQYDNYGTFDTNPWDDQHHGGGQDNFFHRSFFEEFGFKMPEPSAVFEKYRLSLRQFEHMTMPESHAKPFLIFVYSDWCSPCKRMEPMWEKIVSDIYPLGYGVGTVNNVNQASFVRRLQVRHLPTILVVVEERIIPFRGEYSALNVIKFAKANIPPHVITVVDEENVDYFLENWKSNKVPVLMFGTLTQPRLRFLLSAFKYKQYAAFGYMQLKHHDLATQRRFGVSYNNSLESLLIFNERTDSPVTSISRKGELTVDAINNAVEEHKFLLLPRLSSQGHFNELCPFDDRRHICVVLLVSKPIVPILLGDHEDAHVSAFRDYAERKQQSSSATRVRYAYMFTNAQKHIVGSIVPSPEVKNSSYRDVMIFRRLDSRQLRYEFLRGAWSGEPALLGRCSENLQNQMAIYLRRSELIKTPLEIQEFYDEHGPSLYRKIAYKTMRAYEHFMYHMKDDELFPIASFVGIFAFLVILSYCFNYILKLEAKQENLRQQRRHRANPQEKSFEFKTLLHELRAESYNGLVRQLKPGCRSLVILVDDETKEELIKQFTKIVWPWRKNKTLSFGFVKVEKNIGWFKQILLETLESPGRLAQINPRNVIGTVLVLNGFRQYFQIYHAMHASASSRKHRRKLQQRLARGNGAGAALGFEDDYSSHTSDDEEEDYDVIDWDKERGIGDPMNSSKPDPDNKASQAPLLTNELLVALPGWLERVFEGQVTRYYVSEWPPMR